MATRHQVRQSIVSLLYALEFNEKNEDFVEEFLRTKKIRNEQKNFTLSLYEGVCSSIEALDEAINPHLNANTMDQIGHLERAILRLGAYELLHTPTSKAIIINEAVELAKELIGDNAPKFINGVLDALEAGK
ncbi:transcription antitermination factor NusB [Campylobacter sp.]|uniref:transcription antitermination factor NusB n=1 Tax=Campylobacter sp. TaxID=205 RepID=UPI0026DD420C|nr:transcription antitermination factor NusB [Campylobacter sp.]MDO4673776.1 transcription antitermination factor NusB [Campylobacter sp.]